MKYNKNLVLLSIIFLAILVMVIFGVSYSFFNYNIANNVNSISVGKISFKASYNSISATKFSPISREEALTDANNVGIISLNIMGDTRHDKGIEYLLTAINVHNTINNKVIPISIIVTYEANDGKEIGTIDDNYFDNRGKNSSIYKVLSSGKLQNGEKIVVGYIKKDTMGIDGNITIRAFVDEDDIIISDTYENEGDKVVLTTSEWHQLKGESALSFQVKIEANEGIWVESPLKYICKIATSLNKEICNSDNGKGCKKSGYESGEEIIYGSIVDKEIYEVGNAFDCDVDKTGYNQRFYYLRTIGNRAVLISNNNFEGSKGQQNINNFVYYEALTKLPTSYQWTNVPITFTHAEDETMYAARFITMDDLTTASGKQNLTNPLSLNGVQFLYENSGYATSGKRSTQWIEEVGNNRYRYHKDSVNVITVSLGQLNTSKNCVRPVIEVPLEYIERYINNP